MWGQENRSVIVLVSVFSGCIILYNIWGSLIGLTIFFLVVIYACVSLLVNDDYTTFTFTLQDLIKASENIYNLFRYICYESSVNCYHLLDFIKTFYQEYIAARMNRSRRNTYQLSTESLVNTNRTSQLHLIDGLSPITKTSRHSLSKSENDHSIAGRSLRPVKSTRSLDKVQWDARERNGDINGDISANVSWKRRSMYFNDDPFLRGDTMYSPEGSPWGTSISPKIKSRSQDIKTVQTVAGPLLSSTRFNIDPKVYSDVTSPGLTSRLTKYANEANSKLIQSQYTIGQFPKVNLNCSPTPLVNAKTGKIRTPVTVRVAPPETIKYSPPEKQKILSNICRGVNKSPSVVQVLKEISLKRHASRDDVSLELIKKQKTDGAQDDRFENCDEGTQKRMREDCSRSDEEISLDNASRPIKRTKVPSCYDILNSLSSSTNVASSGVKRKADISRSGTPELGKHFKSLDSNYIRSLPASPRASGEFVKIIRGINKNYVEGDSPSSKKDDKSPSSKGFQPYCPQEISLYADKDKDKKRVDIPIKLTDRLFMKAEPHNIDKLKNLIEGHGNVTSKFSGDDGEEIKKTDVLTMRQTSMKARLRSMFDAISGKSPSQIDPNIVIQAESVTPHSSSSSPSVPASSGIVTLNSSTSTTTINTSPIVTSAITPIIGKTAATTTPVKHVTFQLPQASSSSSLSSNEFKSASSSAPSLTTGSPQKPEEGQKTNIAASNPNLTSFLAPVSSKPAQPTISFGINSTSSITLTPSVAFGAVSTSSSTLPISTANLSTSISTPSLLPTQVPASSVSVDTSKPSFTIPSPQATKSVPSSFGSISTPTYKPAFSSESSPSSFGTTIKSTLVSTQSVFATSSAESKPPLQFNTTPSSTTVPATAPTTTSSILSGTNKQSLFTGGFGTSSTATTVSLAPSFAFGAISTSASQPSQMPGLPYSCPNTTSQSMIKTTQAGVKPPAARSLFPFGANSSSVSGFGSTTSIATSTAHISAMTSSTASASKPVFSFGAPTTSSSITTPLPFGGTTQPSGFPTPVTSQTSKPKSLFINASKPLASTSTTSVSIFGAKPPQSSIFSSASSNTGILPFGTTSEAPAFGTNTSTTSSNIFNGINPAVTSTASIFSGAGSIFGQSKPSGFGTQTTSSFGSNPPSTFGTSSTAFGAQSTSSSFGTTSTPSFGTAPTTSAPVFQSSSLTTSSFGTSNSTPLPSFGTINTTVSFGTLGTTTTFSTPSTLTSSFGSSSTTVPLFGANTNSTSSTFNTATPSFGAVTTAPPAFGSTSASTSFGASTSAGFSAGSSSAPPMFGSNNASFSGFGSSSTATTSPFTSGSSTAPTFGAPTTLPGFGASTSTNASSAFAFGNTNNQTQPQQNSIFSFGVSGSGSSTGSGAGPFQFNTSTSQTGGFNFPSASLSGSFGTSNQGSMFSIGSGSTAPKSRAQRLRRQQR